MTTLERRESAPTRPLAARRRAGAFDVVVAPEVDGATDVSRWSALHLRDRRRARRSMFAGAGVGLLPFVAALWNLGIDPLRMATAPGFASNFYDVQARALMHGRLQVPQYSLGIEGFVIDGRTYMYFPPFPSLLRMPVLVLTSRFDGRLTAPSMLLAWLVLAVATAALIWAVRLALRGASAVSRTEAVLYGTLLAAITGGSIVVFLASLPWVYHEVYLWALAFGVGALAGMVALARHPTWQGLAATAGCALGAILTRTTTGWAMAGTMLAIAAALAWRNRDRRRFAASMAVAAVAIVACGATINWLKFRHAYMFPLEHQIFTQENAHRRLALLVNGGDITGPQFLPTTLLNYLRPDGIRFVPYFPFITPPAEPARGVAGAFVDQAYRTGSVPAFAPLLLALSIWGVVSLVLRSRSDRNVAGTVGIPLIGAVLVSGGVMAYGYIAYRYTSEFVPAMAIGAAIGVVDIARRLEPRPVRLKRLAAAAIVVAALYGALANGAVGIAAARTTYRGAGLESFVSWQHHLGVAAPRIVVGDELPDDAPADDLHILGNCDAVFLALGDHYEPLVAVQARELHVSISTGSSGYTSGVLPVYTIDGTHVRTVMVELEPGSGLRLRIGEAGIYYPTDWIDLGPGQAVDVGIRLDSRRYRHYITVDGADVGYVAASEADRNSVSRPAIPGYTLATVEEQRSVGVDLAAHPGPIPELCQRLLTSAR